jgi:molybdopterin converting factor small subunit
VIRIEVRLYATLTRYRTEYGSGECLAFELAERTTIKQFLEDEVGMPPDEVKTVFVNGLASELDHVLAEGDRVGIFPPIGGG